SVVRRRQEATTVTSGQDAHPKAAGAARAAFSKRLSRLFDLLKGIVTFPALEQLLLNVPRDYYGRGHHHLDTGYDTLSQLRTLWKKHRHEVPEVPVQPRAPQRVRQP